MSNDIAAGFQKVLNSHGHGFHYAVLARLADLAGKRSLDWEFLVAEYPIELNGQIGAIDFVLRRSNSVLIAECKRADRRLRTGVL